MNQKLIRVTTVPASLGGLLRGQLKFMSNHYEVLGVSSAICGAKTAFIDVLENVGKEQGCRVFAVEMTRQITPIADLKATWKLYRLFKREKPFIVHTHTPKAGTLGMIAAYLAKVPHRLHTIAGLPLLVAKGRKRTLLNIVEKLTYSCSTRIYPNSFGLRDIIIENNFTREEKLKVIGNGSSNGIDTSFFDPQLIKDDTKKELKVKLGISDKDFVFVFVGRLVTDKGMNELAQAFDILSKEISNIRLVLVGSRENELDPLLASSEKILESNSSIIAVGTQADVRPFYAIADYLVFPSYREGFPNVVMEAGSMGLPSIVSNINGCNEIIIENENGHIVPVSDMEALLKSMRNVVTLHMNNQGLVPDQIRKLIISRYSRSFIWNEILKEYKLLEK
ncbi:glycosyltransferase family 1 protein [Maribacter sp. MJ134]|uniref:glycosyltransferase family 4 protein n=1 Tax=Maribacter sp. MJ134 TaxID=2496865 RepID=UPI000F84B53A|nr:glycosyltransferase family 4 protein [Maribacter sp. MJ134]AZQ58478.1 glycosyltransferase family 1 protein [Maribacter sp. MJ134]